MKPSSVLYKFLVPSICYLREVGLLCLQVQVGLFTNTCSVINAYNSMWNRHIVLVVAYYTWTLNDLTTPILTFRNLASYI